MKRIILAAALCLTSSAFAQICEVNMVDNRTMRVLKTFRAYDNNDDCKDAMKDCRFEIRQRNQVGLADCVRVGSRPTPPRQPQPIPRQQPPIPQPPMPQPRYGVTVTGLMESASFSFSARNASELYVSCLTDIRSIKTMSVDDVFFSVNNNRFVAKSTTGWYSESDICSLLEQEARATYSEGRIYSTRIVGTVENSPFSLQARDRSELLNSCVPTVRSLGLGSVDDVTFSLNGASFQKISTTGWWSNPAEVCKALIKAVDSQL
jgi:hypothetical protein